MRYVFANTVGKARRLYPGSNTCIISQLAGARGFQVQPNDELIWCMDLAFEIPEILIHLYLKAVTERHAASAMKKRHDLGVAFALDTLKSL